MYERATIIMEMEQLILPLMKTIKRWRFFAEYRYKQLKRRLVARADTNTATAPWGSGEGGVPETAASAWEAQVLL